MLDRFWPAFVIGGMLLIALVFMWLGWRNRRKRQAHLDVVPVAPAEVGDVLRTEKALYVATTLADNPLERVVVGGLGFRAKALLELTRGGLVLTLAGNVPAFIPTDDISGVGLASWTIDKSVGDGQLVFVRWTLGETLVDSYFRGDDPQVLLDALTTLSPTALAAARAEAEASTAHPAEKASE